MTLRIFIASALALLAVSAIAIAATPPATAPERVCFPAGQWDAPKGKRPCVTVQRLYEDGSGRIILHTANGRESAACLVPNPAEERGNFRVRCFR